MGETGEITTYYFSLWRILNYLQDNGEVPHKELEARTGMPPFFGMELEQLGLVTARLITAELPSGSQPGKATRAYSITEKGIKTLAALPPGKLETITQVDLPEFAKALEVRVNKELQNIDSAEKPKDI